MDIDTVPLEIDPVLKWENISVEFFEDFVLSERHPNSIAIRGWSARLGAVVQSLAALGDELYFNMDKGYVHDPHSPPSSNLKHLLYQALWRDQPIQSRLEAHDALTKHAFWGTRDFALVYARLAYPNSRQLWHFYYDHRQFLDEPSLEFLAAAVADGLMPPWRYLAEFNTISLEHRRLARIIANSWDPAERALALFFAAVTEDVISYLWNNQSEREPECKAAFIMSPYVPTTFATALSVENGCWGVTPWGYLWDLARMRVAYDQGILEDRAGFDALRVKVLRFLLSRSRTQTPASREGLLQVARGSIENFEWKAQRLSAKVEADRLAKEVERQRLEGLRQHDSDRKRLENRGVVYVLISPALPGLVKVGWTQRRASDRARELSAATGVPAAFQVVYEAPFENARAAELRVHSMLGRYRENQRREFFRVAVDDAVKVVRDVLVNPPRA